MLSEQVELAESLRLGGESGHSAAGRDAMRDRNGDRRGDPTRDGGVDSPGGARRIAIQRRHLHARAGAAPGCGR